MSCPGGSHDWEEDKKEGIMVCIHCDMIMRITKHVGDEQEVFGGSYRDVAYIREYYKNMEEYRMRKVMEVL